LGVRKNWKSDNHPLNDRAFEKENERVRVILFGGVAKKRKKKKKKKHQSTVGWGESQGSYRRGGRSRINVGRVKGGKGGLPVFKVLIKKITREEFQVRGARCLFKRETGQEGTKKPVGEKKKQRGARPGTSLAPKYWKNEFEGKKKAPSRRPL